MPGSFFGRTIRAVAMFAAATLLATGLLAGCQRSLPPPTTQPATAPAQADVPFANGAPMFPAGPEHAHPSGKFLLAVRLAMYRVELPIGSASRSERLWRYFDEEVTDSATISILQHNGLRVGRASIQGWPAVSRVLEEMTGTSPARSLMWAVPGHEEQITLKEHLDEQHLFIFDQMGCLSGQDYPPGDNILQITCTVNGLDPSEIVLHAVPAVLDERRVQRWELTDQGYQRTDRRQELPISAMEFTVRVPKGNYIVIGPGADVMRSTSPGHSLLISERGGLRFETLLVLVPEVFAAPA